MAHRFLTLGAVLASVASAAPQAGTATTTADAVPTAGCLTFCENFRNACDVAATNPGAPNHPLCASWFSQCIGYVPYVNGNYVTPTACSAASAAPTYTDVPDSCAAACIASYQACGTAAGGNEAACAYEIAVCLGDSPWYNGLWVAPTKCARETNSAATAATVTTVVTAYTTYCPGPTSIVHGNKTITVTGATTLTVTDCPCTITTNLKPVNPTAQPQPQPTKPVNPDSCVSACNKAHDACQTAPGANMAECAAEFAGCLGYNPWGSGSYVAPTACSAVPSSTDSIVVVPTGAAGRVVPGALAALGAFVLL